MSYLISIELWKINKIWPSAWGSGLIEGQCANRFKIVIQKLNKIFWHFPQEKLDQLMSFFLR